MIINDTVVSEIFRTMQITLGIYRCSHHHIISIFWPLDVGFAITRFKIANLKLTKLK